MPCHLHISGESFEPSTVPGLSAIRPFSVYRRGDKNPGGSGFCEVGGVSCEVSPSRELIVQVEDAAYYLTKHHELLRTLAGTDAVRYRTLSFHLGSEEVEDLDGRITLPPLLVRMCAGLDLGVSFVLL